MSNSNVNVFEDIGVIIFVSQMFGVMPYTVGNKFKQSLLFVYFVATTSFYLYIFVSVNVYAFEHIQRATDRLKLLRKIIYVESTLRCALLLSILLVNLFKSGNFTHMLKKLKNFDAMLRHRLHVTLPTRQNFVLQCGYTVYEIIFGLFYCIHLGFIAQYGWRMSIAWAVANNISLVILSQFTVLIHTFKVRFKAFNTYFADVYVVSNLNVNNLLNEHFYHGLSNNSRYRNLNILNGAQVKKLHVLYMSMRDLLYEVNSFYALQVLLIICETVAIIIASISTITFNLTADADFVNKSHHRNFKLTHSGLRLLNVLMLTYMAEETAKEANYTIKIVHDFLKYERNNTVKKELEVFLLDLWHHKVKFHALDFFNLDYHLIKMILTVATTYVIVLIQLQLGTAYMFSARPTTKPS